MNKLIGYLLVTQSVTYLPDDVSLSRRDFMLDVEIPDSPWAAFSSSGSGYACRSALYTRYTGSRAVAAKSRNANISAIQTECGRSSRTADCERAPADDYSCKNPAVCQTRGGRGSPSSVKNLLQVQRTELHHCSNT